MRKFKLIPFEKLATATSPLREAQDHYNSLVTTQHAHLSSAEKSRLSAESYEPYILEWREAVRKLSR